MKGKQRFFLTTIAITLQTVFCVVSAQFTINGRHVVFNKTDSVYMCAIPDSIFTYDYSATITPDTIFQPHIDTLLTDTIFQIDTTIVCDTLLAPDTVIICDSVIHTDSIINIETAFCIDTIVWQSIQLYDDSIVKCEDSIVFKNVSGHKKYQLKAYLSNESVIILPITFTNLPLVVLEGDFGYDYVQGIVHVYTPDSTIDQKDMLAKIKWRGGSTNSANKHKRNYTIKFLNENQKKQKCQLFGLRTHNQWILNAGQIDLGRCRNQIGHELWNDIAHPPYYIKEEPEALTSVRGQFVEVILNQEYRGLYSMSENVDQEQMKLKEYDEKNGIIHGQLWKSDSWDGTGMYDIQAYDNNKETYRGFETKYPDFEDVNPTDYSTLYNAIKFALESNDEIFIQNLSTYFDIPVLIDYYIFMNVLVALDNNGKNMFWACYDKQESPKLTIGVWDLDCTFGQNFNDNNPHPNSFGPEVDMRTLNVIKVIDRMRHNTNYADSIHQRYWDLRQTHFHTDSLIARFENYFNLFQRGGAAYREEQRWSGDSDVAGLTLDFQQELDFIKDWIQKRFIFLDNGEFLRSNTPTNVWKNNMTNQTNNNHQVYNLLGIPINEPGSGIYIKDGKKILIP